MCEQAGSAHTVEASFHIEDDEASGVAVHCYINLFSLM